MSWWNIIKEPTLSTRAGFTPALSNTTYGKKPPCETCKDKETPCGCKIEKRIRGKKAYWNMIDTLMQDGQIRSAKAIIDGLYSNRETLGSRRTLSLRRLPVKNEISAYLRTNKNYVVVNEKPSKANVPIGDYITTSPKEYQWIGEEE